MKGLFLYAALVLLCCGGCGQTVVTVAMTKDF